MARQLMPRAGVVTPYVVVSRDQTIVGVTSVDGQKGPVDLTVKYLTQQNAINNYLTKADAAKTYLTQTGGTAGYLPKIKPTLPVASALLGSTGANGNQVAIADYNLAGVVNTSSATTATIGDIRGDTLIASKTNPTVKVGSGTPQAIYHVGNKPTAADIGAANVDAQGKNTNLRYISAMDTGIDFTGGAKINQNSAQGSVYLRGVSANPEVYIDGLNKQVNITATPAGASTAAIQLKGTTSIAANATEPNQQALRVTGRQTITGDSNALTVVAKSDASAAYMSGYKADGTTPAWRLGKTASTNRVVLEGVGVGTVQFEDITSVTAGATTAVANARRMRVEGGGHSIDFGGLDGNKATDNTNYYITPSAGYHAFNNTVAVGDYTKKRLLFSATAGTLGYEDINMKLWGQYDGKTAPAATARATVLEWGIGSTNYLAYLQKLGNGQQEFHMNGAITAATSITSATSMTCGGGDFNVTNGAAVITRNAGDNVILLRYATTTGFIRGYQSGTQKWYVGQTGADNCVMGNYAAGSSIALNSNKTISLNCGSGGSVTSNGNVNAPNFNGASSTTGTITIGAGAFGTSLRIKNVAITKDSDVNLKKDIVKIDNALDKVSQLNGYTFKWKEDDREDAGFLAQEVQKVLPEVVKVNSDGYLSVEDRGLVGLLLESVKELKARVEELESK